MIEQNENNESGKIKTEIKILKFQNPKFHPGLNVTVRDGTNWMDEKGFIYIADEKGEIKGEGFILNTYTCQFQEINENHLIYEHDPQCYTKKGLRKVMNELYPGFEETDICTVILFITSFSGLPCGGLK